MFPLNSNLPYIKDDGTRDKLGNVIGSGGGGGGSELPDYSETDAGKVLKVDNEGLLEWGELPAGTKIYVKAYNNITFDKAFNLASFSSNAAESSSLYYYTRQGGTANNLRINGYTLISVKSTSSKMVIPTTMAIEPNYEFIEGLISNSGNVSSYSFNAYYVKNEDLANLT